ncbi:MAG: DUF1707 domain-containing protein [Ilumatobacter sp.]
MTVDRQTRISDDDRERYNAVIKTAYAEGRITDSELGDRLEAVLQARFESELVPVVADLPNPPPLAPVPAPLLPPPTTTRAVTPAGSNGALVGPEATPFLLAPIICTAIYAMTDLGGYFWPMWVWFGCSIPVVGGVIARRLSR